MNKTARISIPLLLAICLLPACTRKQAPTQVGNATGADRGSLSDTGSMGGLGDLIPAGDGSDDWGMDGAELQARGDGIGAGKFGDFTMVEGVLPSIYFGFDSSSIAAAERSKLQQAADYLEENPSYHLLIEGHCDWYGTSEYNLALGDRRASSASDYLGTLGITPLRIEKLSKGSLEATSGLSKSESSQDRRADLILLQR
jgi:peptidoglycan-associated lipoprotein